MTPPPTDAPPRPPLPAGFTAGRRRARGVYGAVVGAVVVLAVTLSAVVVGTGEAAHAHLQVGSAAPAPAAGDVAAAPRQAWSTSDRPAVGDPVWRGTVVTFSAHQLSGRDLRTGSVRWSYRRDDLTVCTAGQAQGRAVVVFARDGNCDEISTFDAGTGARGWFRTLTDDGRGGLAFSSAGLVLTYPHSVHLVSADGGIDRYDPVRQPAGCTVTGSAAGALGVLYTQGCADGAHLVLQQNLAAKQTWRVAVPAGTVALGAESALTAYDPAAGTVQAYSPTDGAVAVRTPLRPAPGGAGDDPAGAVVGGIVVVRLGSRLQAVDAAGLPTWSVATGGPATPTADASAVTALVATGGLELDATSGRAVAAWTFSVPAGADRVEPAGSGLLLTGGAGVRFLR